MMKSVAIALSLATTSFAAPFTPNASTWSGWKGVKHLFVFGDSYTQTGFDVNGTQPNPSNPLGNPAYPGYTSSNGPNWVDFLTTTYNASYVQTYNLAYGGATVDSSLVTPYLPTVLSLKDQVTTEYLPTYGSTTSPVKFTSSDSLFAFFIGINDVGNTWSSSNAAALYDQIFTVYDGLLEQVYNTGARNFLFLTVPPVNRAPLTLVKGTASVQKEGSMIGVWNDKLKDLIAKFSARHNGATTTFIFDTNAVFTTALDNPKAYEQTAGYKNTTGYCDAYANGASSWYEKDPSCAYAVNEYFWLNTLHPTFPIHNATAASIVKYLGSQKKRIQHL